MAAPISNFFLKIGTIADTSGLDGLIGKVKTFATSSAGLASLGVAAGTAAVAALGVAAFKAGKDFEEARGLITTGTGATGEALENLLSSSKKVFGQVPEDIGKVSSTLADLNTNLGLTGAPLETLTKQFLDLERLPLGFSGNVQTLTRVFGDWGIATEDQNESLDFLANVSQSTGVGVDSLSSKIVQFGAPMRQFGFDFKESAALLGKFEKEGVNTEIVMSSLRIALGNAAAAGLDTKTAFGSFVDGISNAKTETEATNLAMEVFGRRAGPDMSAAILEGRFELDELLVQLENSPDTIEDMANRSKTLSEKMSQLGNNVTKLIEPLGTLMVDGLSALVDLLLNSVDPAVEGLKAGFGAVATFLEPFITLFTDKFLPIWNELNAFFVGVSVTIGETLIPALDGLGGSAGGLMTFIKNIGIKIVKDWINAWKDLLDFLKKIPGVSDLIEKGQRALQKSTKDTQKETEKQTKALADQEKQVTKKNIPSFESVQAALEKSKKKTKEAKQETFDLEKSMKAAEKAAKDYEREIKNLTPALSDVIERSKTLAEEIPNIGAAAVDTSTDSVLALTNIQVEFDAAQAKAGLTEQAFKDFGIATRADLEATAEKAEEQFDLIANSGEASAMDIDVAWVQMMDARKDALVAAGTDLPAEEQKMLDSMKAKLEGFKKDTSEAGGLWSTWASEVSGTIGGLAEDGLNSLFTGDGSFKEKGITALKSLGDSFTSKFTDIADQAINNLINGGLNSLTGSLTNLTTDILPSLGGAFKKNIPGLGGAAGSAAGQAGGAASGGGGIGGAVAGAGIQGTLNTIFGGISAATGIFSLFQNARQEGTLNAIEEESRKAQIHLLHILENQNTMMGSDWAFWKTQQATNNLFEMKDRLNDYQNVFFPSMISSLRAIESQGSPIVNVRVELDGEDVASRIETTIVNNADLQGVT